MHFFKIDWIENAVLQCICTCIIYCEEHSKRNLGLCSMLFLHAYCKTTLTQVHTPLKLLYGIFFALNYFSMCITLWRTLQTLYRSFARRSASASLCIPPRCSSDWLGPTARLGPPTSRPFHGCDLTRFRSSPPHKGTGDPHPSSFQRISILLAPQNKFDSWP